MAVLWPQVYDVDVILSLTLLTYLAVLWPQVYEPCIVNLYGRKSEGLVVNSVEKICRRTVKHLPEVSF